MWQTRWKKFVGYETWTAVFLFLFVSAVAHAQAEAKKDQGPPAVPVRVAPVVEDSVSDQITLVGNTEAIARSMIAAEVSGLVEAFPVREGDFVEKG
ncbi:MAG TPA: hypothetical protein EYP19_12985, partial [Desulfobacterales bacterium]|nr:hypothetical protein [Desulfobacterales bacterium]